MFNVDMRPAAVPQPAALTLTGIALAGFGIVARRLVSRNNRGRATEAPRARPSARREARSAWPWSRCALRRRIRSEGDQWAGDA